MVSKCRASDVTESDPDLARRTAERSIGARVQPEPVGKKTPRTCTSECVSILRAEAAAPGAVFLTGRAGGADQWVKATDSARSF